MVGTRPSMPVASSTVRRLVVPCACFTPPMFCGFGVMTSRFEPRFAICLPTESSAAAPSASMTITAPTPMMMPSAERQVRSLFAQSPRAACWKFSMSRSSWTRCVISSAGAPVIGSGAAGSSACGLRTSSTTCPSWTRMVRSAAAAIDGSCVTSTMVRPSACNSRSSAMISAPLLESRLPVGSSASTMRGRRTRARAMATRCCCPPESSFGL